MSKTYRQCAIEHLKEGNLCKGYIDYILGEMDKLEQIEQIIDDCDLEAWEVLEKIKEVLENE